jgi:hypothetical protein
MDGRTLVRPRLKDLNVPGALWMNTVTPTEAAAPAAGQSTKGDKRLQTPTDEPGLGYRRLPNHTA